MNIEGDLIDIPNNGELNIAYAPKLFEPYVVMSWTVTMVKGEKTGIIVILGSYLMFIKITFK